MRLSAFAFATLAVASGCADVLGLGDFDDRAETTAASSSTSTVVTVGTGGMGMGGMSASSTAAATGGQGGTITIGCGGAPASSLYVFASANLAGPAADFKSVAEANALCDAWALQVGIPASARFKAWMSEVGLTALDNIELRKGPWYRCDGVLAIPDTEAFSSGLAAPLDVDEQGNKVLGFAFTGTMPNGLAAESCGSWDTSSVSASGTIGSVVDTGPTWTDFADASCGTKNRLYCFQVE